MAFEIVGQRPSTKEGEYFRRRSMWWAPLADYMCKVAPEITDQCESWQTNEGDGLDAERAAALANRLDVEIREGRCERYARIHKSMQEKLPEEPCFYCKGTGTKESAPQIGAGDMICDYCNGSGIARRLLWRLGHFSVENVQAFVVFLRGCGGFIIL